MTRTRILLALAAFTVSCSESDSDPQAPVQDERLLLPWSELSGRIAIRFDVAGGTYIIDAPSRSVKYIGSVGTYTSGIDISPDGESIALGYFLGSGYGNPMGIRVASTRGQIAPYDQKPAEFTGFAPTWRPDGTLSFWRVDTVFVADQPRLVFRYPSTGPHSWSSDGTELLVSYRDDVVLTHAVRAIRIADGSRRDIARAEVGAEWSSPVTGARGDSIILKRGNKAQHFDGLGELWIMKSDGSGRRLLTSTPVADFDVAPDGTQVIVTGSTTNTCGECPRPIGPGVYLIRIDDGLVRKLMVDDLNAINVKWGR